MGLTVQITENLPPFSKLLGITITEASKENIVATMLVREEMCTRPEILHGGAAMAFADTLGAVATMLNLPAGAGTTTMESKTNFFRPSPAGAIVTGECTPVHLGRRTMVWQTRILTEARKLAVLVTQTQMVLPPMAE